METNFSDDYGDHVFVRIRGTGMHIYVCIYVKSDVRFALNINQSINQSTKTLCHMSLATCNIKQIYMKDFFVKKIKQGGWPRPSYENKKGYLDMACLYKTIY